MKLLVTGGAGFIGSNFVHYWVKQHPEDKITVLDALTYAGHIENLDPVKDKITFVHGDITDVAKVDEVMSDADCVVHFAAESHNDRAIANPFIFTQTNVLGTHTLLEAARKHKVSRFHHVSTDEVFGDIPLDQHIKYNESSRQNPRSPYSASKAGADNLVNAYFHTYNLPVTITNCTNNFGPYMYTEKFIPRSIVRSLSGQKVRLYTPGNQIRDWLYVEDHCRAIELVLQKGKLGETYCVGGMTEEISNKEVALEIVKILGLEEDRIEMVTDRPGHDVKYALDWTKINRELGWQPQREFSEWLKVTVEWYKNNQAWWQPHLTESEAFYQSRGEQVVTS